MDNWKTTTEAKLSDSLPVLSFDTFQIREVPSLPTLNWRAIFTPGKSCVIEHGSGVEVHGNTIFEGVWADEFEKLNFSDSDYVYGSGAIFKHGKITFTPPTHSLESIYLLHDKSLGNVTISNSIISCLAVMDHINAISLVDSFAKISSNITGKMTESGVLGYETLAHNSDDASIHIIMHNNLEISSSGSISIEIKSNAMNFRSFKHYKDFMLLTLSQINSNGESNHRSNPLIGLSTISRGYDSAAVSALCSEIGVSNYCTIDATIDGRNDSGSEIANHLGLDCDTFTHPLGEVISNLNAELDEIHLSKMDIFLATVGIGDNYPLLAFDSILQGKVLYTGGYGDVYWAKNQWKKPGYRLTKPFERSVTEYRLERGFTLVPVPSIGMLFPESALTLTHKLEMRPWRVGGRYDRPIPRRILEERGVPRSCFGIKKNAVNPFTPNFANRKPKSFRIRLNRYLSGGDN